jgi:hypothetical protein
VCPYISFLIVLRSYIYLKDNCGFNFCFIYETYMSSTIVRQLIVDWPSCLHPTFENVPYAIPSFISPHRPKPGIRANKNRMRISESDSSSSISVDERLPRMATIDAARLAGKSVKPIPFPELSPLRNGLAIKRQVASTSPARTTLKRLKKGRAERPQPEMSSSSDELESNRQLPTFRLNANRVRPHNNKKLLNGNKTVTAEPSIMTKRVAIGQKE